MRLSHFCSLILLEDGFRSRKVVFVKVKVNISLQSKIVNVISYLGHNPEVHQN